MHKRLVVDLVFIEHDPEVVKHVLIVLCVSIISYHVIINIFAQRVFTADHINFSLVNDDELHSVDVIGTIGWGEYGTTGVKTAPLYLSNGSSERDKFILKVDLKIQIKGTL